VAKHTRHRARRSTAAALVVALGWPTTGLAATGPAADAEPAAGARPETGAEEPEPSAEATRTEPSAEGLGPLYVHPEQAARHWQEGVRLYNNGRYAEAAEEFERSYAAVPAAAALYSAALSYERAGKPVEAVRALERYLALTDCADLPEEERTVECTAQRAEAKQLRAEQRGLVGELVLTLGEGVKLREVRVAGRTVPLVDFPLLLPPGTVDVEVFGLRPEDRRSRPASITAGEVTTLYVAPFESESAVVPRPEVEPPDDGIDEARLARRRRQLRVTFWTGVGLTAASAAAMAVTGSLALYHHRRFEAEFCGPLCVMRDENGDPVLDENGAPIPLGSSESDLYPHDHEAELARYRPVTNALLGVTLGLAVGTALLGTFAFRKRAPADASGGQARVRARARAQVRLGGSGLVVRW
jgi:hypothetical protein